MNLTKHAIKEYLNDNPWSTDPEYQLIKMYRKMKWAVNRKAWEKEHRKAVRKYNRDNRYVWKFRKINKWSLKALFVL